MGFDCWDYTNPILWKIPNFPQLTISPLAPSVTNMLDACRSLIGGLKLQHGVTVENFFRQDNDTNYFFSLKRREPLFNLNFSLFVATIFLRFLKVIIELFPHLNLTKNFTDRFKKCFGHNGLSIHSESSYDKSYWGSFLKPNLEKFDN